VLVIRVALTISQNPFVLRQADLWDVVKMPYAGVHKRTHDSADLRGTERLQRLNREAEDSERGANKRFQCVSETIKIFS
jgi:hypothetical protein